MPVARPAGAFLQQNKLHHPFITDFYRQPVAALRVLGSAPRFGSVKPWGNAQPGAYRTLHNLHVCFACISQIADTSRVADCHHHFLYLLGYGSVYFIHLTIIKYNGVFCKCKPEKQKITDFFTK
ncbi:MAG: hypothetical protein IKK15_01165 [Akkermansia sp.]|nr:hypothetical protein [Akkermansia sp.]